MNTQKIANLLQISANFGILLGLVLVTLQIQQNTGILKTQMLFEESHRAVQAEQVLTGENGAGVENNRTLQLTAKQPSPIDPWYNLAAGS